MEKIDECINILSSTRIGKKDKENVIEILYDLKNEIKLSKLLDFTDLDDNNLNKMKNKINEQNQMINKLKKSFNSIKIDLDMFDISDEEEDNIVKLGNIKFDLNQIEINNNKGIINESIGFKNDIFWKLWKYRNKDDIRYRFEIDKNNNPWSVKYEHEIENIDKWKDDFRNICKKWTKDFKN